MTDALEAKLERVLDERKRDDLYRELSEPAGIDFCSNDYLGLARNVALSNRIVEVYLKLLKENGQAVLGSTGSRLISGDSRYHQYVENYLKDFHGGEAALMFNSGYDANVGIYSALPQRGDVVICDELVHNSILTGLRLGRQREVMFFSHNNFGELHRLLESCRKASSENNVFIGIESVYSMDGDVAPIREICDLASRYNALVIVDEAHGTGVYGRRGEGYLSFTGLRGQKNILCATYTFGKAIGCQGAVVVSSLVVRAFLINYARTLIYTTSMGLFSLVSLHESYKYQAERNDLREQLQRNIVEFRRLMTHGRFPVCSGRLMESSSPIQCILVQGNRQVKRVAAILNDRGVSVKAIRSPTVKKGSERLRVIIHSFNTEEQIRNLATDVKLILRTERASMPRCHRVDCRSCNLEVDRLYSHL